MECSIEKVWRTVWQLLKFGSVRICIWMDGSDIRIIQSNKNIDFTSLAPMLRIGERHISQASKHAPLSNNLTTRVPKVSPAFSLADYGDWFYHTASSKSIQPFRRTTPTTASQPASQRKKSFFDEFKLNVLPHNKSTTKLRRMPLREIIRFDPALRAYHTFAPRPIYIHREFNWREIHVSTSQ